MDKFQSEKLFRLLKNSGVSRASLIIEDKSYEFVDTTTIGNDEYLLYETGSKKQNYQSKKNKCPHCNGILSVINTDESIEGHIVEDVCCTSCGKESQQWYISKIFIGTIKNEFNAIPISNTL